MIILYINYCDINYTFVNDIKIIKWYSQRFFTKIPLWKTRPSLWGPGWSVVKFARIFWNMGRKFHELMDELMNQWMTFGWLLCFCWVLKFPEYLPGTLLPRGFCGWQNPCFTGLGTEASIIIRAEKAEERRMRRRTWKMWCKNGWWKKCYETKKRT